MELLNSEEKTNKLLNSEESYWTLKRKQAFKTKVLKAWPSVLKAQPQVFIITRSVLSQPATVNGRFQSLGFHSYLFIYLFIKIYFILT